MSGARDRFGNLRCGIGECPHLICAATGLDEIARLRLHLRRSHRLDLDMIEALNLRAEWERRWDLVRRETEGPV